MLASGCWTLNDRMRNLANKNTSLRIVTAKEMVLQTIGQKTFGRSLALSWDQ